MQKEIAKKSWTFFYKSLFSEAPSSDNELFFISQAHSQHNFSFLILWISKVGTENGKYLGMAN